MLRTLRERGLALLLLITNDLADVGGVSAQQEEKPDQYKSAYAAANGDGPAATAPGALGAVGGFA